jgi:hypothetical protein
LKNPLTFSYRNDIIRAQRERNTPREGNPKRGQRPQERNATRESVPLFFVVFFLKKVLDKSMQM